MSDEKVCVNSDCQFVNAAPTRLTFRKHYVPTGHQSSAKDTPSKQVLVSMRSADDIGGCFVALLALAAFVGGLWLLIFVINWHS